MRFDPTPLLRWGVRYAPWSAVRAGLWSLAADRARRPREFVARTRYGFRYGGDQRLIMPRCIYWFGQWEPLLSAWMWAALGPGEVFVDVGANAGYFTLLASTAVGPSGQVVAIEPSARTRTALEANLARNAAGNVRTVGAAVGAADGTMPFYRAPWNDAESSTVEQPGLALEANLRAARLPALLTSDEAARTSVVKIDIEGGEADALRGMTEDSSWMPTRLRIAVEMHTNVLATRGLRASDLIAPFADLGFVSTWLPVDFSERAHLHPPDDATARTSAPPEDELFHLILARG